MHRAGDRKLSVSVHFSLAARLAGEHVQYFNHGDHTVTPAPSMVRLNGPRKACPKEGQASLDKRSRLSPSRWSFSSSQQASQSIWGICAIRKGSNNWQPTAPPLQSATQFGACGGTPDCGVMITEKGLTSASYNGFDTSGVNCPTSDTSGTVICIGKPTDGAHMGERQLRRSQDH